MSPKSKSPSSSPSPSILSDNRASASPSVDAAPRRKKLDLSAVKKWLEAKQRRHAENDDDDVSIVTTGDENPPTDDSQDGEYRGRLPARSRIGTVQAERDAVSPIRPRRSARFRPASSEYAHSGQENGGDDAGGVSDDEEGGRPAIRPPSITPPPPLPQSPQTPSRTKKKRSARIKSTAVVESDSNEDPGDDRPATSSSTKRKRIRRKSPSSPLAKKARTEPLPFPLLPPLGASPSPSSATSELPSALDLINEAIASRTKKRNPIRTPSPSFLPASKSHDEGAYLLRFFDDEASEEGEEAGDSVGTEDNDHIMRSEDEYDYADSFIDDGVPDADHSDSDASMQSRPAASIHSLDTASVASDDAAVMRALKALKDAKKARAAKKAHGAQAKKEAVLKITKAKEKEEKEEKKVKEKQEKESRRAKERKERDLKKERKAKEEKIAREVAKKAKDAKRAKKAMDAGKQLMEAAIRVREAEKHASSNNDNALKSALKTKSPAKSSSTTTGKATPNTSLTTSQAVVARASKSKSAGSSKPSPSMSKSSKKPDVVEISSDSEEEAGAGSFSIPSKSTSGTKPLRKTARETSKKKSTSTKTSTSHEQTTPSANKGKQRALLRSPSPTHDDDGDTSDGGLSAYERELRKVLKASRADRPPKVGQSSSQGSTSSTKGGTSTTPVSPLRPGPGVSMEDFLKSVKPIAEPKSSAPKNAAKANSTTQSSTSASPSKPFDPNADPTIVCRCKDLPEVDEVNDPALQDPVLADQYVGLPNLRRGILTPWTDARGKGFISFSTWAKWIPNMNAANAYNAVNFKQAGRLRNPARVSPLDIALKTMTGTIQKYNFFCATNPPVPLVAVSAGWVHKSQLLSPSLNGVRQKFVSIVLHSQEWQRTIGFISTASGFPYLHGQFALNALQISSRANTNRAPASPDAAPGGEGGAREIPADMFVNPEPDNSSTSVGAGDNFSLPNSATIPVYDARNAEALDFEKVLPRLAEELPVYTGGEIPFGSFVLVGYTITIYRANNNNWTLGCNIQWVVIVGIP
ncbi:hypothetical protein DFP72DRAFT_1082846 [Ephemerocybe angulata]|uniref:Uncharacterized protein n=1 Tax=Ephemerocybe angulata TaxID=980116 RepID=A0A8H6H7T0_9AGAR|nr:hypothetical protein DFP72DRAFT_1082846 [Tulosesus angulatus]